MKTAIYSRKSVLTERGESVENQIEMCRKYIDMKMGGGEAEIYEDEGFSGKNAERPGFQRLLRDIRRGDISAVVCYRLDRISRNVGDFAALSEELIRRGVSFISVKEEFDTSAPMGKAMMFIASVFAQLERETIAERVKDNMQRLSKMGRWLGGTPPTGYKPEKCEIEAGGRHHTFFRLCELPAESRKVKLIFSLFLNLKSCAAVRRTLLKGGIKTRFGNDFSDTAIKEILKNPVYAACDRDTYDYFSARGAEVTFSGNDFGKGILPYGRRHGKSGAADIKNCVIAAGEHPFFISGKEYVAVQKILEEKKRGHKKSIRNREALLQGLLYCKCGREMRPKKRSNSDKFDYICSGKLKDGKECCKAPNLAGLLTDDRVFSEVLKKLPVTDNFFKKTKKLKDDIKKSGMKNIYSEIKSISRKIDNLINALSEGEGCFAERIKTEINRLMKERETLLLKTEKERCEKLFSESILTPDDKRAFLNAFIEKAVWDGEKINIYLFAAE